MHGYILKYIHFIHIVLPSLILPSLHLHRLVIEKYMSHTSILTILYDGLCTSVVKDLTVVNANATANC